MSTLSEPEIRALSKIIDELNYYEILRIPPGAGSTQIRHAYHSASRTFHPDVRRRLDTQLQTECDRISKRVTEAYCVLRDPRKRQAYDAKRARGEGLRIQISEARALHEREAVQARQGRTPEGRELFRKATEAIEQERWGVAFQNLQLALSFEAENPFFRAELDALQAQHPVEALRAR